MKIITLVRLDSPAPHHKDYVRDTGLYGNAEAMLAVDINMIKINTKILSIDKRMKSFSAKLLSEALL